jgi:hypothetical protein
VFDRVCCHPVASILEVVWRHCFPCAACADLGGDCGYCIRWEEVELSSLEAVQELHKLSESHPENQRIIGRNRLVLEGVVHVLQNGGAKSKLWCCAVLVNLAYRSEENTAKIGGFFCHLTCSSKASFCTQSAVLRGGAARVCTCLSRITLLRRVTHLTSVCMQGV